MKSLWDGREAERAAGGFLRGGANHLRAGERAEGAKGKRSERIPKRTNPNLSKGNPTGAELNIGLELWLKRRHRGHLPGIAMVQVSRGRKQSRAEPPISLHPTIIPLADHRLFFPLRHKAKATNTAPLATPRRRQEPDHPSNIDEHRTIARTFGR